MSRFSLHAALRHGAVCIREPYLRIRRSKVIVNAEYTADLLCARTMRNYEVVLRAWAGSQIAPKNQRGHIPDWVLPA